MATIIGDSTTQAFKTLQEFKRRFLPTIKRMVTELSIESYRNGRENGYVVTVFLDKKYESLKPPGSFNLAVTFSENRNSDEIVVYPGDFMREIVMPERGDEIYRGRVCIPCGAYDKAARVMAHFLHLKQDDRLVAKIRN